MSLSNAEYDLIMREYNDDRLSSEKELDRKRKYVYEHIPEYRSLSEQIAHLSLEYIRTALSGNRTSASELKDRISALSAKKKALLTEAGLSEDYLEPSYKCPDCRDTGYIDGRKCHCFIHREIQYKISTLYENSGIRQALNEVSFDMASERYYSGEDLEHFRESKKKAISFVENFNSDYQNLLFYGTVGTGKSLLSSCIARELLEREHSVVYFSTIGLMDELARSAFDRNEHKGGRSTSLSVDPIFDSELLIIDDLGTELTNSFTISTLFNLINERALKKRSVIISTNLSLEELRDRYTDRIFSRLTGGYTFCRLSGPDIRIAHKFDK